MAVAYCEYCHRYIDLDWNCEHFDEHGQCENEKEELAENYEPITRI